MKRSPSFQHYPDRLTQPIKHLSWRARGFFRELQDFMWTESPDYCSIPNDPAAWILAVPGATLEEAEAMMAEIQNPHKQLLKVEGDRLVCNGLRKIRARQVEVSQKRSAAGKLGKRAQLSGKTENLPEQPSGKALANANPELANAKNGSGKTEVLPYGVGDGVGDRNGDGVGDGLPPPGDRFREMCSRLATISPSWNASAISGEAQRRIFDEWGRGYSSVTDGEMDTIIEFNTATHEDEKLCQSLEALMLALPKQRDRAMRWKAKPPPKQNGNHAQVSEETKAAYGAALAKMQQGGTPADS